MNVTKLPSLVVVIDDTVRNANVLSSVYREKFPDNCPQLVWLYAGDKFSAEEMERHLAVQGSEFNCKHGVRSMPDCASTLRKIVEPHLTSGVVVYLDVALDNICTSTKEAIESDVSLQLRNWIENDERILVHVHSTDKHSGKVAKSLDPSGLKVESEGGVGDHPEFKAVWEDVVKPTLLKWRSVYPSGLEDVLWSQQTESWFQRGSEVEHNHCDCEVEDFEIMGNYLDCLFQKNHGGSTAKERAFPATWLNQSSNDSKRVHEALKHLTGNACRAQGTKARRNLNLASAALLLIATCSREGWNLIELGRFGGWGETDVDYLPKILPALPKILPADQEPHEARYAIRKLIVLFKVITRDRVSGDCTVARVEICDDTLRVFLKFSEENGEELIDAVRQVNQGLDAGEGDFRKALKEFIEAASVSQGNPVPPVCTIQAEESEGPKEAVFQLQARADLGIGVQHG